MWFKFHAKYAEKKLQERKGTIITLYLFANLAVILAPFAREFIFGQPLFKFNHFVVYTLIRIEP